jgi:hypothetical protein
MMRGRERWFATVAIWGTFAFVMAFLIDRFTRVTADFRDLWSNFSYPYGPYGPQPLDENLLAQIRDIQNEAARLSQTLLTEVNQHISAQLAANMPILVILSLALIVAATLSTYFVWQKAHLEPEATPQAKRGGSSAKAKRGGRAELVMNTLDDDELAELRARLIEAEQVEAVSFEELLVNPEGARRR